MKPSSWSAFAKLGLLFAFSCSVLNGQEDLKDQPIPRAVPLDELLPKFDTDGVAVSRSLQYKISGSDPANRGAAANLAEEAKNEILGLLNEKDEWKVPVLIEMYGKYGDAVPLRTTAIKISFNEVGYQVRIFVNLSRGLQKEPFQRAVISGTLLARALKDAPKSDDQVPYVISPWIFEGISEAISWRLGQSDRRLYDASFKNGGLYDLEDLFELDEAGHLALDAASRAAFRISSGALIMALNEQPDGKAGMRSFLKEAPSYNGEMPALLRKHFPELNLSQSSLAKWWTLQLAAKGSAPLAEVLSIAVTDQDLERALKLRYHDKEAGLIEVPFGQWEQVPELSKAERHESVRLAEQDLIRLSYRCFPSYRPLLNEYQIMLSLWVAGDTKKLSATLTKLAETRVIMVGKSERARDFLDWFEISRARETSGAFDDYLTLKTRLKTQLSPRKDSVTKYLDRLDPLFVIPQQPKPKIFPLNDY